MARLFGAAKPMSLPARLPDPEPHPRFVRRGRALLRVRATFTSTFRRRASRRRPSWPTWSPPRSSCWSAACASSGYLQARPGWLPGARFQEVPGKFELAVSMTRIMFPCLLLWPWRRRPWDTERLQPVACLHVVNVFQADPSASPGAGFWAAPAGLLADRRHGLRSGAWRRLQLIWQLPSLRSSGFTSGSCGTGRTPGCGADRGFDGYRRTLGQRRGADQRPW